MKKLFIPLIALIGISSPISSQVAINPAPTKDSKQNNRSGENVVKKSTLAPGSDDPGTESKSKEELKGDKQYFVYDYDKAIETYSNEENLSVDGQRKLAKSYYNMNKNAESQASYQKLIGMPGGNLPEDYFNYSMALKASGKYDEAAIWMDKFEESKPADLRAKDYEIHKSELNNLLKDNAKYKINNLNINTDAEDFGTSYFKNKIVFASSRTIKSNPKTSYRNGKPYLNMYISEIDKEQLKTPENFDKSFNGKMNEGPASFSKDGTFMAFTKNNYNLTKKELIVNVEIFFSTFDKEKNEWSEPESFNHNNKDYSVGQPALSADGKTMYFTCNMPGGCGGADLYVVTRGPSGTWGTPENLGTEINTEGDEVFPFFQENKGVLYFTSNGHFGLGGLDIFSSTLKGSKFGQASNMGYPLNTSSDDFSLITDSAVSTGYFSSNRTGGKGDDDIYSINFMVSKKLNGIAMDKNETPLASTFITLLDDKGGVLDTLTTKADGTFTFKVETNKNFKLTGKKEKYNEGTNSASTFGPELIVNADVILLMPPKEEVVVEKKIIISKPVVEKNLNKIAALKPIYFDYHEYVIRPDAKIELDKIVKIMNDNPSMIVELNAHTDCRATKEYNQVLSNNRAKASGDYIKKRITNPSRITGKGYGENRLVNDCGCDGDVVSTCSEDAHQQNRRTEFRIMIKD